MEKIDRKTDRDGSRVKDEIEFMSVNINKNKNKKRFFIEIKYRTCARSHTHNIIHEIIQNNRQKSTAKNSE